MQHPVRTDTSVQKLNTPFIVQMNPTQTYSALPIITSFAVTTFLLLWRASHGLKSALMRGRRIRMGHFLWPLAASLIFIFAIAALAQHQLDKNLYQQEYAEHFQTISWLIFIALAFVRACDINSRVGTYSDTHWFHHTSEAPKFVPDSSRQILYGAIEHVSGPERNPPSRKRAA
jgi:hypothetical protein